jgi:hypothetical protein
LRQGDAEKGRQGEGAMGRGAMGDELENEKDATIKE